MRTRDTSRKIVNIHFVMPVRTKVAGYLYDSLFLPAFINRSERVAAWQRHDVFTDSDWLRDSRPSNRPEPYRKQRIALKQFHNKISFQCKKDYRMNV